MSANTTTNKAGGFTGDPAAAFAPPAAGGCCGSAPTTGASVQPTKVSTCCGTVQAAEAAGSCCDPGAKAEAVANGAGCCG